MQIRLVILLSMLPLFTIAQNLIPNPGFEKGVGGKPDAWLQPAGTNFHWDTAGYYGRPRSGQWFNGMCISNVQSSEALTVALHDTLDRSKTYHISAWIRKFPGTNGTYNYTASRELQVLLTWGPPNPLPDKPYKVPERQLTRIPLPPDSLLLQTDAYQYIEATFQPSGGERFISFSYFQREDPTRPLITRFYSDENSLNRTTISDPINAGQQLDGDLVFRVRYYVDDFCLAEIRPDGSYSCTEYETYLSQQQTIDSASLGGTLPTPVRGQKVVLKNVLFEFDTTQLLPSAFPILDSLVRTLKANPHWRIQINAHTDVRGAAAYNQILSNGRAQTVVDYLIRHGIAAARLQAKGFGETQPISAATTEAAHQINRRVEFERIDE